MNKQEGVERSRKGVNKQEENERSSKEKEVAGRSLMSRNDQVAQKEAGSRQKEGRK